MKTTGQRIVSLRDNLEMSQLSLAKRIHITATTLSKYEKDLREPRGEVICRLAQVLGTTSDYLLCRTDNAAPLEKGQSWCKLFDDEHNLLECYRLLPEREKGRLSERMQILLEELDKKTTDFIPNNNAIKKRTHPFCSDMEP